MHIHKTSALQQPHNFLLTWPPRRHKCECGSLVGCHIRLDYATILQSPKDVPGKGR
jgi:hypothetical protein